MAWSGLLRAGTGLCRLRLTRIDRFCLAKNLPRTKIDPRRHSSTPPAASFTCRQYPALSRWACALQRRALQIGNLQAKRSLHLPALSLAPDLSRAAVSAPA